MHVPTFSWWCSFSNKLHRLSHKYLIPPITCFKLYANISLSFSPIKFYSSAQIIPVFFISTRVETCPVLWHICKYVDHSRTDLTCSVLTATPQKINQVLAFPFHFEEQQHFLAYTSHPHFNNQTNLCTWQRHAAPFTPHFHNSREITW